MRVLFVAAIVMVLHAQTAAADTDADRGDFTVALIPDTQYYCDLTTGGTPEMYYQLTDWIKERAESDNIRFAIHLGDLVQNPNVQSEWIIADRAQETLQWTVPYSVLPGNHDLGSANYYDQYFGPNRFDEQPFYGGHEGATNNNNYCFFRGGGMDFMVLNLEYDPSYATLNWANQVIADNPNHRVIVSTHSYLTLTGRKPEGDRIWNNLVKNNDSIFMVVSGHVSGWNHQTSTNDYGNPVSEILTDYQWEPDGLTQPPLGGDGWLNTMKFVPEEDKIYFKSYSPYLDEWRRTALHEYTLDYDMLVYLPGDTNFDGAVNETDAAVLAAHWQETGKVWSEGDFNDDGNVDDIDATILAANWTAAGDAAVPEPASIVLILMGLLSLACRRCGKRKSAG